MLEPSRSNSVWMSARAARMRLGISRERLLRLALSGQIATLNDPGVSVRFKSEDVERLAGDEVRATAKAM